MFVAIIYNLVKYRDKYCCMLLSPPKSEIFAHYNTGVEGLDTEVHGAVNIAEVRQLDPGVEGGGGGEVRQRRGWGGEQEVFKGKQGILNILFLERQTMWNI